MRGRMFDPLSGSFTRADPFMPNADTPKGFNPGTDGAFGANKSTTWEWDALHGQPLLARNSGKLLRISDSSGQAEADTYGGPFALRDSVTRTVPRPSGSPLALETQYEYDPDGRLEVLRHPGGRRAQTYRYNEHGALQGFDAPMSAAEIFYSLAAYGLAGPRPPMGEA